jgi:hypothetical protein
MSSHAYPEFSAHLLRFTKSRTGWNGRTEPHPRCVVRRESRLGSGFVGVLRLVLSEKKYHEWQPSSCWHSEGNLLLCIGMATSLQLVPSHVSSFALAVTSLSMALSLLVARSRVAGGSRERQCACLRGGTPKVGQMVSTMFDRRRFPLSGSEQ